MKLIWQNPSSSDEFPQTELSIDLSQITYIIVTTKYSGSHLCKIGRQSIIVEVGNYHLAYRVVYISTGGILFHNGVAILQYGSGTQDSTACAPQYIYTVK